MNAPQTIPAHLPRMAARYDISDEDLADQAERVAASMLRLADLWGRSGTADAPVMRSLRHIAKRHATARAIEARRPGPFKAGR